MKKVYDQKTNDYMFRYLEKYVGTYRVMANKDEETGKIPSDDSFEDFYIPCKNKVEIRHTYEGNDILAIYVYDGVGLAKNISKELTALGVEHEDEIGPDSCILFNAKDIKLVAKVVKPKTAGKNIHPLSARNNRGNNIKKYTIPEKDIEKLHKNTGNLSNTEKMQFFRKTNKEFIEELSKETGIDCKAQMKIDGLKVKEYIHMNGYWDKYVKFVNKKLKKR